MKQGNTVQAQTDDSPVTVTVDVPRELHRLVKAKSALQGETLAGHLLALIRADVKPPPGATR